METKNFWNNVKKYDEEIISIFVEKNILTKKIENIKNKKDKIIGDFGCGVGNSFRYIKYFKKIYAIDYAKNLLEKAKLEAEKLNIKNIEFINDKIQTTKLKEKCDVILAISSIFPNNINEFNQIINNLKSNSKKSTKIFIVTSSLEARIFYLQLYADLLYKKGFEINQIYNIIKEKEKNQNLSSFGYMKSKYNLIQKQWLKEELLLKLKPFNFQKIEIEKLELNWITQVKKAEMSDYEKIWLWLIKIEV